MSNLAAHAGNGEGLAEVNPAPPVAIGFVWDVATGKLAEQIAMVDGLDTKAGILVGALAVALGAVIQSSLSKEDLLIVGGLLTAAAVCALRGFLVGRYIDGATPDIVAKYANTSESSLKELFLSSVLEAHTKTRQRVLSKGQWINRSVFILGVAVILMVVGKAAGY